MEEDEAGDIVERFIVSGREALADVQERMADAFDEVGTLTSNIILLSQMVYRLSAYSDETLAQLGSSITTIARALADENPAERKSLPPNFRDGRQFNVELAEFREHPPQAVAEVEWILDRLNVNTGLYCAGVMVAATALAFNLTIASVVSVVCEHVAGLQAYDESPEGQAELAGGGGIFGSESLIKTVDACWGLMGAAINHGPAGFLAYRDASAYLRSPSGWSLRKHVAEAEFDGERAPIRASVSAAFNAAGRCKWVTTQFKGSEQQDLVQLRDLVCEMLARKHGKPTYAKRDIVEWTVEFVDARVSTSVELDGFGNMWTLNVSSGMKSFW